MVVAVDVTDIVNLGNVYWVLDRWMFWVEECVRLLSVMLLELERVSVGFIKGMRA